jgi:hypothetical protein
MSAAAVVPTVPAVPAVSAVPATRGFRLGRTFLHPAFDYLVIGGGLSLVATVVLLAPGGSQRLSTWSAPVFALLLLLVNLAHFAASTIRLYTKPGAYKELPFLTMGLPLLTLVVLFVAMRYAETVGAHLMNLYFTWSPYHYAAQAYGLSVMYCYRSGVSLEPRDKLLLRVACLSPFLYAFFRGPVAGIEWFVPATVLTLPAVTAVRTVLVYGLGGLTLLVPVALAARAWRRGPALPVITLVVIVSNAMWWTALMYMNAFAWATVFHGLQYLAIVSIFHVRDQMGLPDNRHRPLYHAAWFYLACVALAYVLFKVWPYAFVAAGFGLAEAALLVVATINIHHFIVDAYIWRLRRDPNYRIVTGQAPALSERVAVVPA